MKPVQTPSFMSIDIMVIELHIFNKDKMNKMSFRTTLDTSGNFIFVVYFGFNMLCAKSEIGWKLEDVYYTYITYNSLHIVEWKMPYVAHP